MVLPKFRRYQFPVENGLCKPFRNKIKLKYKEKYPPNTKY